MFAKLAASVVVLAVGMLPRPASASSDPLLGEQWGLSQIGAAEAWSRSTGRGVPIGIVDTGIDLGHEDLAGRVVAHVNCIGGCGSHPGQDDSGHGTFVAGVAAASTGNGLGIAGVAPDATLVVAKVLNREIAGEVHDISAGIRWVVDHGARVVNVSISDGGAATVAAAPALRGALEYAWRRGAVPVVAAGSSDYGTTNALVVTATKADGSLARASGHLRSAKWGLAAPGGDPAACSGGRNPDQCVLSTSWSRNRPDHYQTAAGASAAVPHVSGVVAQLLAAGYDQRGAVERVLATADNGVLDAAAALGAPVAAPTPAPAASRARQSIRLADALGPRQPISERRAPPHP